MTSAQAGEWRRGWHLVLLTAVGLMCAPTTLPVYTIGILAAPLHAEFGWSQGAIQGAILFSTGLGLIGGPLAGWLVRRVGLRPAILSGVAGVGCALGLATQMTGAIWHMYLAYALIAVAGSGASAVTWSNLIATHFDRNRGLALGIALSGTGLSAILMPHIAAFGLDLGGWRYAYGLLATVTLAAILPLCFALLPAPKTEDRPEGKRGKEHQDAINPLAHGSWRFWLLGLSTAAVYVAVGGFIPNLVPVLSEKGVARDDALSILSLLGLTLIAGRIAVGALIDRVWAPAVAACVLIPAAIGCLAISAGGPMVVYALAAALIGIATGMEFDMLGFLVARYFGMSDYARIYGRLYMFLAVAAGAAPLVFGTMRDHSGGYGMPLIFSALLLVGGAAGLLGLGRYPVSDRAEG
ncbi:MFS transporter [Sphingomonas sp. ID0503]|uniref:MFS transporter n=1 Tax=Sphingomonas sp. ID0503 TaxID=3399691 RepID=UPI003AFB4C94